MLTPLVLFLLGLFFLGFFAFIRFCEWILFRGEVNL